MTAGAEAIGRQPPYPVCGIDSDNHNAFINETLTEYCTDLASNSPVAFRSDATGR